jgi:hypothetical protein
VGGRFQQLSLTEPADRTLNRVRADNLAAENALIKGCRTFA